MKGGSTRANLCGPRVVVGGSPQNTLERDDTNARGDARMRGRPSSDSFKRRTIQSTAALVIRRERFIVRTMSEESNPVEPSPMEAVVSGDAATSSEATETEVPADVPTNVDPLAEAQAEVARLKNLWLRAVADTDNLRKRTRREVDDARRNGREDMLRTLLPVFDNLERAIDSAGRATDIKAVADGLVMVQRQFGEALGREGIARVAAVGQPFDPGMHEAIQHVESAEHAPGMDLAEVQAGYRQGDRLLRAAMVIVAKAKSETSPASDVTS